MSVTVVSDSETLQEQPVDDWYQEYKAILARVNQIEKHLARVERYGADQWRRGNKGAEPQEFDEWLREQAQ